MVQKTRITIIDSSARTPGLVPTSIRGHATQTKQLRQTWAPCMAPAQNTCWLRRTSAACPSSISRVCFFNHTKQYITQLTLPGTVLNVFESVDVIALIKGGSYDDLNLTVGDALLKRSAVRLYSLCSMTPLLTPHRTSPASSPALCKTACPPSMTPSASRASTASSSSMRTPSCAAC